MRHALVTFLLQDAHHILAHLDPILVASHPFCYALWVCHITAGQVRITDMCLQGNAPSLWGDS